MMKKVTAVLLGAGQRGAGAYAPYALKFPEELQFVAVADPDDNRRGDFQAAHRIEDNNSFRTWQELLEGPKLADAIFICTQDKMHFDPTIKALEKGYHVLLEKPMSNNPEECVLMGEYAEKYNRIFSICHVLRYTNFFSEIKKLLDEGRIGKLMSIQLTENVGYWHQAHSFVRGNWRNSSESSPMILSKSCHDLDIMLWLAGSDCVRVSSFGSLSHFTKDNAPSGAPKRCTDGCPVRDECAFYAPKIYLDQREDWQGDLKALITHDTSREGVIKALQEGPYGRCVYHCDNDVVDHQVVNLEFENEVTAAFTMTAFTNEGGRTIKLMGTKGDIKGHLEKNEIIIADFASRRTETIQLPIANSGHGGGDDAIIKDFIQLVQSEGKKTSLTSADVSVQSHMMAFAAEKSRLEHKVIDMKEYMDQLSSHR